jgi:hypothetical protein
MSADRGKAADPAGFVFDPMTVGQLLWLRLGAPRKLLCRGVVTRTWGVALCPGVNCFGLDRGEGEPHAPAMSGHYRFPATTGYVAGSPGGDRQMGL